MNIKYNNNGNFYTTLIENSHGKLRTALGVTRETSRRYTW